MRIGVLPLARPTFDVPFAEAQAAAAFAALDATGHDLVGPRGLLFDAAATREALAALKGEALDRVLVLQVTFTDASMTCVIAEELTAPLLLWAVPEPRAGGRLRLNAFCGLNLAAHALKLRGKDFGWLYAAPDSPGLDESLALLVSGGLAAEGRGVEDRPDATFVDAKAVAGVLKRLGNARIGVVGEHPLGFDTCAYDPDAMARLCGASAERIELPALFDRARAADPGRIAAVRAETATRLGGLDAVDQEQLDRSLRVFAGLSDLAREKSLDALAVRCWPEMFTEYGCAACGPMAMMNGAKVPAACEADVYGALSALVLQELAGEPSLLVDLVDLDPASDTGVVWHCGLAPLTMADPSTPPRATIHSNRRMPLLHEFALKPGRITAARFTQAQGRPRLMIAGATMLQAPMSFTGTSGVLRFDADAGTVAERIMGEGLEHHFAFAYGEWRPQLRAVAGALGLPVLEIA
ncbi:L-fucose/L-arabinose isomerase family protein [Prosthecomicrobium sp. N25]|uniref:L-fucose/L-arabinose isomerase family protein n=1 Tax=Prosthecomicrobium sp. N25 TaxID=3129254 RepID=UPI003076E5DE